jgi:A/G-specific adenine glycosylase
MAFPKAEFRRALVRWFRKSGRGLPWRDNRDPYAILVSEFMLQQTQVATVIPYYCKWLRRFPDFVSLARASENDVLYAWQGLGYYSRARNLHSAAKIVQDEHGGIFPRDIAAIRKLPGVGRYTANAVATFAFDQAVPIVEANTARVLARLFNLRSPIDQANGRKALWNRAATLVPKRGARIHNSALLDLGALICLPRKPKCVSCPVNSFCRATRPALLPIKKNRSQLQSLVERHVFSMHRKRILLEQSHNRWRGMWILPPIKLEGLKPSGPRRHRPVYESVFPFTHHRVKLRVFRGNSHMISTRQQWFAIGRLNTIPIPSPHRRAVLALLGPNVERPRDNQQTPVGR